MAEFPDLWENALNAALILTFAVLAWRTAMQRNFVAHRKMGNPGLFDGEWRLVFPYRIRTVDFAYGIQCIWGRAVSGWALRHIPYVWSFSGAAADCRRVFLCKSAYQSRHQENSRSQLCRTQHLVDSRNCNAQCSVLVANVYVKLSVPVSFLPFLRQIRIKVSHE